jgi:hypothetical protein
MGRTETASSRPLSRDRPKPFLVPTVLHSAAERRWLLDAQRRLSPLAAIVPEPRSVGSSARRGFVRVICIVNLYTKCNKALTPENVCKARFAMPRPEEEPRSECVYVYTYICLYVCMYVCMYVCVYIYIILYCNG